MNVYRTDAMTSDSEMENPDTWPTEVRGDCNYALQSIPKSVAVMS